jgi:hypothetical protein
MIRVNIVDLKPGMVLAQSVQNHQGVLLLDAGTKITKKNIRIFKSWGVTDVTVKGEVSRATDSAGQPELPINESDEIQLKKKFADVLDDPVMVEIFNAARKLLIKDLPKNEHEKENSRPKKNYR